MKRSTMYVLGGGALLAAGLVGYAYYTDPKRRESASGATVRRSPGTAVRDFLDISRTAAQNYRDETRGGGGYGDDGGADTSLYDAAGGTARTGSGSSATSQYV